MFLYVWSEPPQCSFVLLLCIQPSVPRSTAWNLLCSRSSQSCRQLRGILLLNNPIAKIIIITILGSSILHADLKILFLNNATFVFWGLALALKAHSSGLTGPHGLFCVREKRGLLLVHHGEGTWCWSHAFAFWSLSVSQGQKLPWCLCLLGHSQLSCWTCCVNPFCGLCYPAKLRGADRQGGCNVC